MSHDHESDPRFDHLMRRLDRIETYLGLTPVEAKPPVPAPAHPPLPVFSEKPEGQPSQPAAIVGGSGVTAPGQWPTPPTTPPTAPPISTPSVSPIAHPPVAAGDPRLDEVPKEWLKESRARRLSIERWIGERWYAVVGAIVIVIGVGLFAKIAIERGWFAFPVIWRCAMGAFFGVLLIGVGEYLRRRVNDWAAAGIMAAGLGSIYASTYAAYRLYEPLTSAPGLAFALLALVAAFGIALSLHARFSALGLLSLTGGYLVPLLFYDTESSPLVMPAYLLTLLAVGLVVSARAGGGFTYLRTVSSLGTIILGGVWTLTHAKDEPLLSILFVLAAWLGIQFELVVSARRYGLNAGDAGAWGIGRRARSIVLCLSITTWAVLLGIVTLKVSDVAPDWMAPAAIMAATAVAGLVFAGHLEFLRQMPEEDLERLGVAYLIQSCGCLFVTITLALSGGAEVLAWFALAITGLVTGRRLQVRAFSLVAVLSLTLATGRLVLFDSTRAMTTPWADVYGIVLSTWMGLMLFAGLAWVAAGAILRSHDEKRRVAPVFMAAIGSLVLLGAFIHDDAHTGSVAFVWAFVSLLVFHAWTLLPRLGLRQIACAVCLLSLIPGVIAYGFDWDRTAWNTLAHPGLVLVLLQVGLLGWYARKFYRSSPAIPVLGAGLVSVGIVLLLVGTSLEVARLGGLHFSDARGERAIVSIWWGLFALGLIAAGFAQRLPSPRRAGLALMGVAVLKALIIDLRGVPELWRVASYVGLGLLMLVVALVYSRLAAALDKEQPPAGI